MKVTCLIPVFGSNRILGHHVGKLLEGCSWVGVPFCGGLSEIPHIKARTLVCGDKHRDIINLASCVAHPTLGPKLWRALRRLPFHADVLQSAQARSERRKNWLLNLSDHDEAIAWAIDYFICAWMGRNGVAGTDSEFKTSFSVRWEPGGGDSAKRFRNAADALREWNKILARATFVCEDVFDFLDKCKDRKGHGLYLDPPWVDDGAKYRHKFTLENHRRLAARLLQFRECRVVVRYGVHPLIRELYPTDHWRWVELDGRDQANKKSPEVLLVNF